jgi:histidinol-phosphate aminotransferase
MTFNSILDNVQIYEAGKPIELVVREYGINPDNIIKLASNENPYGPSPKVIDKLKEISPNAHIYPDDSMHELKEALADKFKVNEHNVIVGAGSDQIIEFCIHAKCNKDSKILMSNTTFAMYEIYGRQTGATIIKTEDDEHNLYQFTMLNEKEKPDVIFLCLPNNPLGECLYAKDVYKFLEDIDENTLVILDGAYQEYASFRNSAKSIDPAYVISRFQNVLYLGTFSKAYALGGMRVGYGIANQGIINTLYKLRPPFNITTLSLAAAIEALKDEEYVTQCIKSNFEQMANYESYALTRRFEYIPSYTNFFTMYTGLYKSNDIAQKLLEKGIIVRDMTGYGLNAIRITVGTEEQNKKVFNTLDEVFKI